MGSVTMPAIDVVSKHVENVINSHIMFNKSSNVYGMIDQIFIDYYYSIRIHDENDSMAHAYERHYITL